MNEEKLLELLKQHFPTREDHQALLNEMRSEFADVKEHLTDLKASAKALDKILERHPIPRIERLEKHAGLPPYAAVGAED